jgi:MoxR-like ATPase
MHPVSPIDFSIRQRQQKDTLDLLRFTTGPVGSGGGSNNKLAQAAVIQRLDEADALVQATLLELMVAKELRMANVRYTVPKPFLVIVIVPHQHQSHISSQLLDRFFVSYSFCGDDEQSYVKPYHFRRTALIKSDEIQMLAERSHRVHINIDITRYIRDIVVGVRTHPLVSGGLTARTSRDLVSVTRSLATLFQHDFLTPDLVAVAADKVLGHRIHLVGSVTPSQVVSEVLRVVYVPV